MGLLSLILFVPLVGAAVLLFLPSGQAAMARTVALGASGVSLLASLILAFKFDTATSQMQFVERLQWVPEMGMSLSLIHI